MGYPQPEYLLAGQAGHDVLKLLAERQRKVHGNRGFSLIELMTAITLLGILIAIGLPTFSTWIHNTQVRTVAESLQTGLRIAQTEALRRNRQVVLSFTNSTPAQNAAATAGGKNWSLQWVPQWADPTNDPTNPIYINGGALTDVASGVTIADHSGTGISAVCFSSNGRLVTNAAPGPAGASCAGASMAFDIAQATADRPLRVIVQLGGQLRLCDPNRPTLSASTPDGCP